MVHTEENTDIKRLRNFCVYISYFLTMIQSLKLNLRVFIIIQPKIYKVVQQH